jgi:hypothetical protein
MEMILPDQQIEEDTTRSTAHLEAFGRFLETTNPFALWAQAAQLALFPWLGAASALMVPLSVTPKLSQKKAESGN